MPDDRMTIDATLAQALIAAQFPQWAGLPVEPVLRDGWDNRTFRLGAEMKIRLPSAERYAAKVAKEFRWLSVLAAHLPLPIPQPLALGAPGMGYPWPWSVYRWIAGETASVAPIADLTAFATELADFLLALQQIDAHDGPAPGPHNFFRGGELRVYDAETRHAIAVLNDEIDARTAIAVWELALASHWSKPPVWLHGDVSADNLIVENGRLSGVIDFGGTGVGDPACDLVIAWTFFTGESRDAFRHAISADDATWARARGWAL